jgi:uncharacterized integral membrane protein
MAEENDSTLRLTYNAIGCGVIAAISLGVAFMLAFDLASMQPPHPEDPDAPKALGLAVFGMLLGALFGVAAVIDLLRTVRKLRGRRADAPDSGAQSR